MGLVKKILIVDDEKQLVELLEKRLKASYRVFTAYDGDEALRVAKEQKPDLIVADILMPRVDGYQMVKGLKADRETSDIPVIFLTAVEETSAIYKAKDMGVVDYLIKPIYLNELPDLLDKYL